MMMSSKIKAAIRIRPFLKSQIKAGYLNSCIKANKSKGEVEVFDGQNRKYFNFDYIFDEACSQQDIYDDCNIDHLIEKSLKGYHSTIFAYGQTGSGKTFTMHGDQNPQNQPVEGLIPKIFLRLFEQIKNCKDRTFMVSLSFLQIYNEKIYDLLNPASVINSKSGAQGLRLRWNKDEQFSVQNLFIFECKDEDDLMSHFETGLKNRISASHKLNLQSSRSHSILTIRIQSFDHYNQASLLTSKIQLVDLAGSERIGLTGAEGIQAKQSIDINKSLFTLRQVITILSQSSKSKGKQRDKTYVPYRDSKLTSILKQSIGGNSYCLMIACINPNNHFLEENVSTLTYATKASYITNQPIINDDPRTKIITDLKKQVFSLTEQLSKANEHIEMITSLQSTFPKQQRQPSPENKQNKRVSERVSQTGDQFSERLIESINMVRELLKSNKQLREKLENSNQINVQKDVEIYELFKQNEFLKQKGSKGQFIQTPNATFNEGIRTSGLLSKRKQSAGHKGTSQLQHYATENHLYGSGNAGNGEVFHTNANSKGNFSNWNSVQINQYYMNERGVDSVPTNFSRREVSTSNDRRIPRGSSVNQRGGGRNALTAKFNSRAWKNMSQNPKQILSFYQQNDIY